MGLEENDLIAEISDQPLMNFFLISIIRILYFENKELMISSFKAFMLIRITIITIYTSIFT